MEDSKISLSPAERGLMQDAELILTKNTILLKVKGLLENIQEEQQAFVLREELMIQDIFQTAPKISRGENYLGLPWMILDFPRVSKGDDLLLVRTMFWWGKFFSSTLHASGIYQSEIRGALKLEQLKQQDLFLGVGEDPWVHHFADDNYKDAKNLSQDEFSKFLQTNHHLKLAFQWPLSEWDRTEKTAMENWKSLLRVAGLIP